MPIIIDTDLCESNLLCVEVCPEGVLEIRNGKPVIVKSSACTDCGDCIENCPSGAIDFD